MHPEQVYNMFARLLQVVERLELEVATLVEADRERFMRDRADDRLAATRPRPTGR